MAETIPKVKAMVERAIKKDAGVKSADLYERAKKIDSSISDLSVRQFHASYALAARRKLKPATKRKPRKKAGRKPGRKKAGARKSQGRSARRPGRRSPAAAVDGILEERIHEARNAFDAALENRLSRARKSGKITEYGKVIAALERAAGEL